MSLDLKEEKCKQIIQFYFDSHLSIESMNFSHQTVAFQCVPKQHRRTANQRDYYDDQNRDEPSHVFCRLINQIFVQNCSNVCPDVLQKCAHLMIRIEP